MKGLRFIKRDGGLAPFDSETEEVIKKWRNGSFILVDAKEPRNYEHHKKFFALLDLVYKNTDDFKTFDNLLSYMKIQTGWADIIEANGIAFRVPKSIAFGSMSQDDFNLFYNNAVDECLKLIPMDKEDLAREIALF